MRTLFTIHAGEYIFGKKIMKDFDDYKLWIPAKDEGIDFLITRPRKERPISVQVKMSQDYSPTVAKTEFDKKWKAGGWLTFRHKSIAESRAEIWSLILISRERKEEPRFINIKPKALLEKLQAVHGQREIYHPYPWIIEQGNKTICVEGRGLNGKKQQADVAAGTFPLGSRDWTDHYDNWDYFRE